MTERRFTLVSFHAHPDDEALFTGGTLAAAAADGHRVVLVVATLGERGLTGPDRSGIDLAERRHRELLASAERLGCARVVVLGYADSGSEPQPPSAGASPTGPGTAPGRPGPVPGSRGPFATADVEEAAAHLAEILVEERADVLTTYDAAGGYGHPDHVQVHRVGARAAEIAGTPMVLEATVDRSRLTRSLRWLRRCSWIAPGLSVPELDHRYTAPEDLTHRIDVRPHIAAKLAALEAHGSQATGGSGERTLAFLLRLPRPVARRVLGAEWFVERGRPPGRPLLTDVFATLRQT